MNYARVASMFERFGDLLAKELQTQGFVRLDAVMDSLPVERHGAWEWTFCRPGDLNRYIAVSIVPHGATQQESPPAFSVHILIGADNRDSFIRRAAGEFILSEQQFKVLPKSFLEGIADAVIQVQAMTKGDLTEHYLELPDTRNISL